MPHKPSLLLIQTKQGGGKYEFPLKEAARGNRPLRLELLSDKV